MKKIFFLTLMLTFSLGIVYGQESLEIYKKTDTVPKVVYKVLDDRAHTTIEIQGKDYLDDIVPTLKAEGINSIGHSTEKKALVVELKPGYKPVLINLSTLKNKYTNVKSERVLFKIDDRFVQQNPDEVLVDESNIMLISVSPIKFTGDLDDLFLITIFPRSDKNLKNFNAIRVR
ncbi:hypothetical protein [Sphingobacterium sp.]|uniref:hypothetical protein n=1 Tax=Sphingobacterium sp. TaxID=341027 RepID=UPI0028A99BDF|nr:hypothetical protein [Sphingobacterium sp.]